MSLKFKCGLCGHKMKADEKHAGRTADCQNCGGTIIVPAVSGKIAAPHKKNEDDPELFEDDDAPAPTTKLSMSRTTRLKRPAASSTGEKATRVAVKKSKSKKNASQNTPSWVVVSVVCGSLAMFLLVGVGLFTMGGGLAANLSAMGKVKAPETFEHFHHEHWVGVDYPTGFELTSGGGTGGLPAWIKVVGQGGIEIQIREDHAAEAIGDIAQAAPAGPIVFDGGLPLEQAASDLDPVASVHSFLKMKVEPEFSGYEEQTMVPLKAKLGDARTSDFTASSLIGGKTYGLRGTVLAGPIAVKVIATCNKRQWEAYKPVFIKMVESISRD